MDVLDVVDVAWDVESDPGGDLEDVISRQDDPSHEDGPAHTASREDTGEIQLLVSLSWDVVEDPYQHE